MPTRSSQSTITFDHDFRVPGRAVAFPPGTYEFVVEEERMEGVSFEAYRRTGSWLVCAGQAGARELVAIDPRDLDAALDLDQNRSGGVGRPHG